MHILKVLDSYLLQLEADGRSVHTRMQYRRHVRLLASWLDQEGRSSEVGDIDHTVLARFLVSPAATRRADGRPKRATSTNTLRTSLRVFFHYLSQAGTIPTNPARLIRRAVTSVPPPRHLTEDEQRRLLDAIVHPRDKVLFSTMLMTGIRVGAVVSIDVSDVDLDRGELAVTTKQDRRDTVILGTRVVEILREWIGARAGGPLFQGRGGRHLTTRHIHRRLRHWCGKAGIQRPVSPHALRHTHAMNLQRQTGDLFLVKAALNHRSICSTMTYVRCDEARLRAALG